MGEGLAAIGLALTLVAAIVWRRHRHRLAAIDRLDAGLADSATIDERSSAPPLIARHRWVPFAAGAAVALVAHATLHLDWLFTATFAAMVTAISWLVEEFLAVRRVGLFETQLADAIDLVVASLRAGAGVMQALESAAREARSPLKDPLENLIGRIRLGDDPSLLLGDLSERLPLETFRLFTFALSVHWEVGGSLAPTLATVGRSIRDRIELGRRVRSQSTEAQASVIGVLAISYAIGVVMWKTNPERMKEFVGSSLGGGLLAFTMLLQTAGIVWMARLSRIRI